MPQTFILYTLKFLWNFVLQQPKTAHFKVQTCAPRGRGVGERGGRRGTVRSPSQTWLIKPATRESRNSETTTLQQDKWEQGEREGGEGPGQASVGCGLRKGGGKGAQWVACAAAFSYSVCLAHFICFCFAFALPSLLLFCFVFLFVLICFCICSEFCSSSACVWQCVCLCVCGRQSISFWDAADVAAVVVAAAAALPLCGMLHNFLFCFLFSPFLLLLLLPWRRAATK